MGEGMNLERKPDALTAHIWFDERDGETEPKATSPHLDSTKWRRIPSCQDN